MQCMKVMSTHTLRGQSMSTQLSDEISAMAQIESSFSAMDDSTRQRVLLWAASKFGVVLAPPTVTAPSGTRSSTQPAVAPASPGTVPASDASYNSLADLYDAAGASSDQDKALVGAYWLQFHENASDIESQAVNTLLKHLGHGIGNITRAFDGLKSQKPALLVQTRKDGTSKQARKRFKVTTEGRKYVDRMLSPGD